MLFLLLAVLFATIFSQFYKIANNLKCDLSSVNMTCYLSGTLLLLLYLLIFGEFKVDIKLTGISVLGGVSTFVAIFAFFRVVKFGKLGISWTIISLSLITPILFSVFFWNEKINIKKFTGIVFAIVAVIFLARDQMIRVKQKCG